MLVKKDIRVKFYTLKKYDKELPIGKIFMIIDREDGDEELKKGKHTYYGCQLTSSAKQVKYEGNIEIIEEHSRLKYYVKGDQIYYLNIDLDELVNNPKIDINFNIRFSEKVFDKVIDKLNESITSDSIEYYDSVEDVLELMKKVPNQKYILEEEQDEEDE